MKSALALCALLALPALASAQTIWRCGPDGRSFSDTPCTDGRALVVADTRPGEDLNEARALAQREIDLAEKLRRERLAAEAAQRGNGLAALGPTSSDASLKPKRRALREKPALRRPASEAGDTFRAVAPASRRGKG